MNNRRVMLYFPWIYPITVSNKEKIKPQEWKTEPTYTLASWDGGYSFKHFWGNCFFLLGEFANVDGMQQLCQHYYLQNGSVGAILTVARIKKFLGIES